MTTDERFHSLDALRASALLLGIALHATMSFLPGFREIRWPISDVETSASLGVFFYVVHIFRMATFFLVAGFFARLLFLRLGQRGFIKNRLRRIALPLLAFFPVVMPLCILPLIWAARQVGITGPGPAAPQHQGFPWGHFWFLYLLLVLYALLLTLRALVVSLDPRGLLRALVDRLLHGALALRLAPLLLAAPLAAVLYATPWWQQWSGLPTPLYGFVPSFPSVAIFGTSVLFGWCLHRQQSWFGFLRRDYGLYLTIAVLASFAALYLVGVRMNMTVIPMSPGIRAAYAGAYMLAVWGWSLGLVGAAVAWLSAPSARWRYLSDASYWMYLIHVPIVWGLQAWMLRWPLHWALKYALILAIAGALLIASYHYLVRSTFLGKFLNGRKYPRALPVMTAVPSVSAG
jgi:peptidoglycan/LPS O-acetylase OafA/YrhL